MNRFLILDSWRGVSAGIVVISHLAVYSHIFNVEYLNPVIAVDFFFVLSGFVISYAYKKKVAEGISFFNYILVRFGRLYPLHFATLVAIVLSVLAQGFLFPDAFNMTKYRPFGNDELWNIRTIINHLLLLQAMNFQPDADWNAPSWSISVEFYAYIVFFCAYRFFRRNASLVAFSILVLAACFIVIEFTNYSSMIAIADGAFVRCLYGFSAGVIVQVIYEEGVSRFDLVERFKNRFYAFSGLELGAVVLFLLISADHIPAIFAPLVFSILVFVFAFEVGVFSRFLKMRFFIFLGDISYTIYMVHWIFALNINRLQKYIATKFPGIPHTNFQTADGYLVLLGDNKWIGDIAYVLYFILIVSISYVAFRFYERPCRNAFRKFARRY